ncbi:MAG: hypothetical protein Q7W55_07670 [Pseudohongiella sp.]|nr:hypothetical protein [Pseudohongiella sp.]MDO9521371.1 hypothetical protein [Pseudohongiella sp.]MDP2125861.1 hypothetical protein [Pseudohongiella sp.]
MISIPVWIKRDAEQHDTRMSREPSTAVRACNCDALSLFQNDGS